MRLQPSPNFSSRKNVPVSLLVLHYTGMQSAQVAISRLCDLEAKVSSHYVIDETGEIYNLVDESDCAWHAGVSYWQGHKNVNNISVGIEIVNPGHEWGYRPFPQIQMSAVAALSNEIISRHTILPRNVVAHSDVAPQRKEDPGELFDWKFLAEQGVGLCPVVNTAKMNFTFNNQEIFILQAKLSQYGYEIPQNGMIDEATRKVFIAFQRHFRPKDIGGTWDTECEAILAALLSIV